MHYRLELALVVSVVAGLSAGAVAQEAAKAESSRMRMRGAGLAFDMLTRSKPLQEELKLNAEQVGKLRDAMRPIQERRQALTTDFNPGTLTEEKWKELAEESAKLTGEAKRVAEEVLKPEQLRRLRQIDYQIAGASAFADKDVQNELTMTDAQKKKVQEILDGHRKEVRELQRVNALGLRRGLTREERDEFRKKFEEMQKSMAVHAQQTEAKALEVLTESQRKAWTAMQGEKFDAAKLLGPRGN